MTQNSSNKIRPPKLKNRIMMYLLIFTAVVIALIWIFEIVLLPDIYYTVRTNETKRCGDKLVRCEVDELESTVNDLSDHYNICISVYEIRGYSARLVADCHINSSCFIHNARGGDGDTGAMLSEIYYNAKENGSSIEVIPVFGMDDSGTNGENTVYAVIKSAAQREFLVLLNAETHPLASTVSTVRTTILMISLILIVFSAVMSLVISHFTAKPLTKMSRETAKLALGNYNVKFEGGGCRETGELADALNHAAYELSVLDRMQKDLIANISHDLRTPLTLIKGYGEVMRDIPGEMTAENMQVIIDESERLTMLVSDILLSSKMVSGREELHREVFSLTKAVGNAAAKFEKFSEKENIRIIFSPDRDVMVCADEMKISQVLYNLIGNAVNYTGEDKTVTVTQSTNNGICRISVSDSGKGIPKEELPLIWERYYKAREFHKRSVQGSGLGLSIVKDILVLHGARFGVSSKLGQGSTFWFELGEAEKA